MLHKWIVIRMNEIMFMSIEPQKSNLIWDIIGEMVCLIGYKKYQKK